ncbi:hypothetical protein SK128_004529 [Halocaridina rubra]|uniref:Ionotropic glutamate receptor L-glutamate and glycine-binding domain-containing protein n=1 Tax=Halocaridina rubra TaxID=373956 RepID=A0AAN9A6F4_HALRR
MECLKELRLDNEVCRSSRSDSSNAEHDTNEVRDQAWGSQLPNGTWIGMIGDVYEGRADIAIANLDITHQRSTAVDFLIGIASEKYSERFFTSPI